jgi:hypothetical protein
MSTADVLLRIRFLLSQRLEHTATRADNIKLSSTLNDLVNLMPANTELFMVWQALSSSKKDMARFEDNITRLVAFLQSASIANIAPAVASAAAFYNSGLKRATSESGQDATIVTKVIIPPSPPANSPPPPRQVQMGANTPGPVMTAEPIASRTETSSFVYTSISTHSACYSEHICPTRLHRARRILISITSSGQSPNTIDRLYSSGRLPIL